ncbi:hypothetical protein [Sphingobacterium corticibacterium]|uniref:DUF3575 domain-containing protein n=1 Tax=Sphingobacterium corticibacterium TaxID=2484746 RepID=A0A4Q6XWX9_9SPHI|nr:hypothetical protein [Sphingobacterium corticibacterium]RZF61287.1 hypothetical protein EWE74_00095 [Sphingobacterium corticibacterium]
MKKANWLLLTLGIILFSFDTSWAQLNSQHAVGGRFGSATGFSYRYTLSDDRAVEGILSIQSNSKSRRFRMVGLYQYHKPLAENFTWFYGFGGSVGSFRYKSEVTQTTNSDGSVTTRRTDPKSELALSIDGIVGIEYNIPTTPLSVSLDVKPYFDFLQESSIRLIDPFGLTIRYKF